MICGGCRKGADERGPHHCDDGSNLHGDGRWCNCQHMPHMGAKTGDRKRLSTDGVVIWLPNYEAA